MGVSGTRMRTLSFSSPCLRASRKACPGGLAPLRTNKRFLPIAPRNGKATGQLKALRPTHDGRRQRPRQSPQAPQSEVRQALDGADKRAQQPAGCLSNWQDRLAMPKSPSVSED